MSEVLKQQVNPQKTFTIALPCEPENFSKFISGLLGKPQTISKSYMGSYEIAHRDIESVYQLVLQRVLQQNDASLIQFTVQLVFDDNSTVLLNSLADFKSYTEVKPLVVTQLNLSWSFLVKFRDKEQPEKQEIELSFITKASGNISIFNSEDSPIIPLSKMFGGGGFISFKVFHTARTWGADIESLLSGHVKHILIPEGKVRSFLRRHSGKISLSFGLTFFLGSIYACFYSAGIISSENLTNLQPIITNPNLVNEKLNKLLELMVSGYWGKFFFSVFIFSIFSLIMAIFLGTWAENSANTKRPSYILLTRKSEQYKKISESKYSNKFMSFMLSICVGVATGIVSNILFTAYWTG